MTRIKLTGRMPSATMAIAALCLMFAGKANADCGLSSIPRAISTLPASAVTGDAAHAQSKSSEPKPDLTITFPGFGTPSVVGLWMINFTSGGQIVDQGFDMWTSEGLEILNDTPPPATGNVCLGTWIKTGPNTFMLKHPSWTFDGAGNLNGTAIIRETVTVAADGNSFKGTFTVDVLTLSGTNIQHIAGTVSATRITVD